MKTRSCSANLWTFGWFSLWVLSATFAACSGSSGASKGPDGASPDGALHTDLASVAPDGADGGGIVVPTCGVPGSACCSGNSCGGGGCCVKGLCAAPGTVCGVLGGLCSNGVCGSCGGTGMSCCLVSGTGTCTAPGTLCSAATCVACGGAGMACCEALGSKICLGAGLVCNGTTCLAGQSNTGPDGGADAAGGGGGTAGAGGAGGGAGGTTGTGQAGGSITSTGDAGSAVTGDAAVDAPQDRFVGPAPDAPGGTDTRLDTRNDTLRADAALDTASSTDGACPSGSYRNAASECIVKTTCPSGSFIENDGTATSDRVCKPCDPGRYTSSPSSVNCRACAEGTYAPDAGSTACIPCPADTIPTAEGASFCEPKVRHCVTAKIKSTSGTFCSGNPSDFTDGSYNTSVRCSGTSTTALNVELRFDSPVTVGAVTASYSVTQSQCHAQAIVWYGVSDYTKVADQQKCGSNPLKATGFWSNVESVQLIASALSGETLIRDFKVFSDANYEFPVCTQ